MKIKMSLRTSISNWNHEYNEILRKAQKRLLGDRVRFKNKKGRVQSVHINVKGVRVDIYYDDSSLEQDIDALLPEYDP